jgi:spore germination protein YaaH
MIGWVAWLAVGQHAAELEAHRGERPVAIRRILRSHGEPGQPRVHRVVYGYHPYWVDAFDEIRWDLLTHIAYFAVDIDASGNLGDRNGWPNADFVATAESHGVGTEVSFTLFSGPSISALIGSPAGTANAVANMIAAMEEGGAGGINIDFEGLEAGSRDDFTAFIRTLREGLIGRGHLDATISIAGPAVDWTNSFDFGALAPLIDVYFVMGYGYHWTQSGKAGPTGQLRVTGDWRPHISISLQRTLAAYTAQVPPEMRRVIVLGLPYYGRDWPTATDAMHSATAGDGSSVTYAAARRAMAQGRTRRWDEGSANPWYAYSTGGQWHQAWFDDEESIAAKYELALDQGIGGVGIWALGYDAGYGELWDTIDAYFTAEPDPRAGDRTLPIPIASFPFGDARDTRDAPGSWFNAYGCSPATPEYGREWVYVLDVCQDGQLTASITDGAGVDVDLHLLDGLTEERCVARDDVAITSPIGPGRHYLVADTYVSDHVPQEGAYTLSVDFTPSPGSIGCEPGATCVEGTCVSKVAIEPAYDVSVAIEPKPPVALGAELLPDEEAEGCGCSAAQLPRHDGSFFFNLMILASIVLRVRGRPSMPRATAKLS